MLYLIIIFLLLIGSFLVISKSKQTRQLAYIRNFNFPVSLRRKVKEKYPHLTDEQVKIVFEALKDYFTICNLAKKRMVSMPSQVVDIAWHEFILFTKVYEIYCKKAMGRFLHHIPTEAMKTPTIAREGIKRAWKLSCVKEKINPSLPKKLPLLFAIDALLDIEDGYKYSLNCKNKNNHFCAGHIGCASGCGGDVANSNGFFDWFGDSDDGGCAGCGGD